MICPVFEFSLLFHSFPILSLFWNVINFVASIGKGYGYTFHEMPCILLVGKFPKPSEISFTTYNTVQSDFAEVFEKNSKNLFSLPTTEDRAEIPKKHNKNNVDIGFGIC